MGHRLEHKGRRIIQIVESKPMAALPTVLCYHILYFLSSLTNQEEVRDWRSFSLTCKNWRRTTNPWLLHYARTSGEYTLFKQIAHAQSDIKGLVHKKWVGHKVRMGKLDTIISCAEQTKQGLFMITGSHHLHLITPWGKIELYSIPFYPTNNWAFLGEVLELFSFSFHGITQSIDSQRDVYYYLTNTQQLKDGMYFERRTHIPPKKIKEYRGKPVAIFGDLTGYDSQLSVRTINKTLLPEPEIRQVPRPGPTNRKLLALLMDFYAKETAPPLKLPGRPLARFFCCFRSRKF